MNLNNPFRPLVVHRNFRLFWSGHTLSLIGTWMQSVAQGWLALELTNNAFMVGVVSAAQALPVLLFSLYAGVIADRYNKFRLIVSGQTILLLQALILWYIASSPYLNIWWMIGLAGVNGIVTAFETPTRQSFIADLVGKEDLRSAIALNSTGFNLARIVGPSIAALVISTLGLSWCFGFNAVSYFAVLISLFFMRLPQWTPKENLQSPWDGLKEGLIYIRRTPEVSTLIKMVGVFSIFGMPIMTLMPVMARDVLNTDASGYGFLLTSVGVGALTGALSLAWIGRRIRGGRLYLCSAFLFATLVIIFATVTSQMIATLLVTGIGFVMILNTALANSILQTIAPDELRGRVVSAYVFVFIGMMPVGSLLLGALARAFDVRVALTAGATIMLLNAVWVALRNKEVLKIA